MRVEPQADVEVEVQADETDVELVARARGGDKDAFGELAERYSPMARRIARRMVSHHDLADDLVQEALVQAYLSLRYLKDDQRFRSWLYGIALNVCRSFLREQKVRELSLADVTGGLQLEAVPLSASSTAPDPHEIAEQHELLALVLDAIQALSPKDRAATLLFYFEALSVREIAALLNISEVAVRVHLHRARSCLRNQLLPIYSEEDRAQKIRTQKISGRKAMVSMTIADVIEQKKEDANLFIVILLDAAGRRLLPIWVGSPEGMALVRALKNVSTFRPMALDLMRNSLQAVNAKLEEVRIETLKGETFYAVIKLRSGNTVREVDARPSDALALAALLGSPILVAEKVLDATGMTIAEAQVAQLGKGLDALAKIEEEKIQTAQARPRHTEEEKEKSYKELEALLFGAQS